VGVSAEPGGGLRIRVERSKIEAFCKKWKIVELGFFGSVLRDDFRPDSDIDVLYTLSDDAHWGWTIFDAEDELAALLGRQVDLVPRKAVEESDNYIRRRDILEHMQVFYVA
jgi:predicted nucleotidyltransferase